MDKICKVFNFDVKQIGLEEERMLAFTGSTENVDRDGDIIEAMGWDLTDYNNNPVIMGFHEYQKFPYAKSTKTYIDYQSKELKFEVKFPTISELTSFPGNADMIAEHAKNVDMAYNMYKNGYMSAVSVGFIGKEAEPMQDEQGNYKGRRYKKQSLLELSLVPVPSNPTALMEARSKGLISDKELKTLNLETEKEIDISKETNIPKEEDIEKSIDPIEEKAGASISAKNREMLTQAMGHMQMAMDMMGQMMAEKPPGELMEEGCKPKSNEIEEIKTALEEIKFQVLLLSQKSIPDDANEDINLDAIEFQKTENDADNNELNIKPEELKQLITEILNTQIKGGN